MCSIQQEKLSAGFSRKVITPPVGTLLQGYPLERKSTSVHDDLCASAVVLAAGDKKVAIVALDIVMLESESVAAVKRRIHEESGMRDDEILINTSHTHSGPITARSFCWGEFNAEFVESLAEKAADCVADACKSMSPAKVAASTADVSISINRRLNIPDGKISHSRDPQGPRLDQTDIVCLSLDDGRDVVLFSAACHGVVLSQDNLAISGDCMGAARGFIEANRPQTSAVFLQGAAGDQNPDWQDRSMEEMERIGRELGKSVLEGLASAEPVKTSPLRMVLREVELPLEDGTNVVCKLHAVRLGDVLITGLSAEPFVEYAFYVKDKSPCRHNLVLGYTNGEVGYLPTRQGVLDGGYEVEVNKRLEAGGIFDPSVEDVMKRELDRMIEEIG